MKTNLLFVLIFGFMQIQGQTLEFKNSRKIMLDNKPLSRVEVHQHMKDNTEALQIYKSGKTLRTLGDIGFFGGIAIAAGGVLLNNLTTIGDKEKPINYYPWQGNYGGTYPEKNHTLSIVSVIVGGGMMISAIPLKASGKKKIRKSVELYNEGGEPARLENPEKYQVSLLVDAKGTGIRVSF